MVNIGLYGVWMPSEFKGSVLVCDEELLHVAFCEIIGALSATFQDYLESRPVELIHVGSF